jgi:predicted nucleotide-binding protein
MLSESNTARNRAIRIPRQEVKQKLEERLQSGEALLNLPMRTDGQVHRAEPSFTSWDDYNSGLLVRLFATLEEAQLYVAEDSSFINLRQPLGLRRKLENRLGVLRTLLEQLDLYEDKSNGEDLEMTTQDEVFIVHGRDDGIKEAAARWVLTLGFTPIILHEQANAGRTVFQKFKDHADRVVYALVLLTPDDVGRLASATNAELKPRARQNVILELGYFLGALAPGRVCALYGGDLELPSDVNGVLYVQFDLAGAWKYQVLREMKAAGLKVDLSRAL